jgi:hypothetical protein
MGGSFHGYVSHNQMVMGLMNIDDHDHSPINGYLVSSFNQVS